MMQLTDLRAIVIDATGVALTKEEEALLRTYKPAGFILFRRNCVSKQQVKDLVASVRASIGYDVPVLIDQEGGTVSRLKSPEWEEFSGAKSFGDLGRDGFDATRLNSLRMAAQLLELGITVNCAPVVDVPAPDCHQFLSASRTYNADPELVGYLGEAVCRGLLAGNVTPVIKHIPGHGRAKVDSHMSLPLVEATRAELTKMDFKPFKYLSHTDMKTALWAMSAHVVYSSLDPDSAASVSRRVTDDVVRGEIGFDGVLLADDISMKALGGTIESRVKGTLAAGMDLTMICNASLEDRRTALEATSKLTADAARRIAAAEAQRTLNGTRNDKRSATV